MKEEKIMENKYKIYFKDKIDFLKFYEKPINNNELKQRIFWREIENNKVEIKLDINYFKNEPEILKDVISELNKIKN